MRSISFFRRALYAAILLILLCISPLCLDPAMANQQEPTTHLPSAAPPERRDPWAEQQQRDMEKKQNVRRQQDIKRDTEKLLELSTELKQYVDKTNENIISMDVIKKADQIEKLAKSIKDKMKGY